MPFLATETVTTVCSVRREEGQVFHRRIWGRSPYSINFGISRIMPVGLTRLNSKVSIPSYEAVGMHASIVSIMSPFFPIACARLRHSRSVGTHLTVSSVSLMALSIDSSMRWFSRSCAMHFALSVARSMRPSKTAWACTSAKLSRISATMRPMTRVVTRDPPCNQRRQLLNGKIVGRRLHTKRIADGENVADQFTLKGFEPRYTGPTDSLQDGERLTTGRAVRAQFDRRSDWWT